MDISAHLGAEIHGLRRDGRGLSLLAVAVGWAVLLGTRMIYPVLLPYFRDAFDLSLTLAGLLVTILWFGSAVGQLPSGVITDRYGGRVVMALGATLVAVALVGVVAASTPIALVVGTGVVGIGQSLYPVARITVLSGLYPDRLGSALGVTMAMGDLGQTVLPPIAGLLAAAFAWQAGLAFAIPMLLLVTVGIWVTLPEHGPPDGGRDAVSARRAKSLLSELRRANVTFVSLILVLYFLTWQAFTGLYPTYLIAVKGLSGSAAGLLFSAFFALGIVVKPLSGAAFDRIGMRNALVVVLVGPAVGLAVLPFVEGFWRLAGVTAAVSLMLGSGTITQSFLANRFSEELRGTGLGLVRGVVGVVGSLGPVIFGGLADRGYFDEGYLLLAAMLVLVVVLTLRLPNAGST